MKLLTFFLFLFFCNSMFGQIDIQNKQTQYKIDETIYLISTFSFCNKSLDSIFIWISEENVRNLNDSQKIKSYFLKRREDFSLLNLIIEKQIKKTDVSTIFKTFLKVLAPNEIFKIEIISKNYEKEKTLEKLICFFNNHFVSIEGKKINSILKIKLNDYPFYINDSLELNEFFLNYH